MRELFLATFKGASYGIWKDEILSVKGLDALHRIPLTPDCIAGIMMEDGQSVTLADLPVCIGHDATRKTEPGCILLKEGEHRTLGFVVSGELRTLAVSPELVFPLPDYLRTPVFDSCAVHDGVAIPLINLAELHGRVLNPDAADNVRQISAALSGDIAASKRFRLFASGSQRYAASDEGLEQAAVTPGAVTPLPNTPRYLRGVGFCDGRLLSVIDLARRLKIPASQMQSTTTGSVMLVAKTGTDEFGFLVDSDEGSCAADEVAVKPAPAIVQTPWLRHVLVRDAQLIPLIDLAATLMPGSDEQPVWQRYTPASVFPDSFFRQAIDVQGFTLLGELYALPKTEVEEVIPYQPCRTVPDAPPIVLGITEYKGEILPVVDLAMMFGRRSLVTPSWRMMLVSNGDFRALVLTERTSGETHLQPETHRAMPIHLPHRLIYGCYPDGIAARVILNVAAIVMHFDRSLIQGFMPALSEKMRMSPSAVVYDFSGDRPADVSDAHQPAEASPPVMQPPLTQADVHTQLDATEPDEVVPPEAVPSEVAPSEVALPEVVPSEVVPSEVVPSEVIPSEVIPSEAAPPEVEPLDSAMASPSQPTAQIESGQQPSLNELAVSLADANRPTAESEPAATSPLPVAQNASVLEPSFTQASGIDDQRNGAGRRSIGYAAIVVMLAAALVLFTMLADEADVAPPNDTHENEAIQATPKPAPTVSAPSRVESVATRSPIVPEKSVAQTNEPLVLEIPASMPIEAELYVVKQGDTLWSISQRLTGNPYNYPRIAGSNNIANPDLIFPGQRIRLQRKE